MAAQQAGRRKNDAMSAAELRARIKALGLTYNAAAEQLGLTPHGLHKQLQGVTGVSRQTALLLGYVEGVQTGRRKRQLATRAEQQQEQQRGEEAATKVDQ